MKNPNLMKKRPSLYKYLLLFFILSILSAVKTNGATYTIKASNYEFDPANITVSVGDTIVWQWDGGKHTTTSSKIPDGAASWDAEIKSSNKAYTYVVTVPGEYSYVCTPHVEMGMIGTITVLAGQKKNDSKDKGASDQGSNKNNYDSYFSSPSFELVRNDRELLAECVLYHQYYYIRK
jgi:plastocyanin